MRGTLFSWLSFTVVCLLLKFCIDEIVVVDCLAVDTSGALVLFVLSFFFGRNSSSCHGGICFRERGDRPRLAEQAETLTSTQVGIDCSKMPEVTHFLLLDENNHFI